MDILLNKDGKVNFVDGKFRFTEELADKVSQRLYIRLRSSKGYWFMDKTFGLDWLYAIFGKRKTKNSIDTILQNEIYKDKYVLDILSWSSKVEQRSYSCSFTVKISGLQEQLLTIRLMANESGFVIQDSQGNQYQVV